MKHLLSTIIFLFAVILKGNAESYSFPSPNEINSVINLDLKGIFSSTHTKSLPLTPVEASLVDNTLLNISFVVHWKDDLRGTAIEKWRENIGVVLV